MGAYHYLRWKGGPIRLQSLHGCYHAHSDRVERPPTDEDARVGLLEAKLVSFGVGHHNPAAWAQSASVVNDRCTQS